MLGVNDQGLGPRKLLTIRKWHFLLNSIAARRAVSLHQDSIIRADPCSPFPPVLTCASWRAVSCLFLTAMGDGIPVAADCQLRS